MKNCLVLFKRPNDKLDIKTVYTLNDIFVQANFTLDSIHWLTLNEKDCNIVFFNNIRQAYDNVIVIKCTCDKSNEDEVLKNLELYNESHTEKDFSLFVLGDNAEEQVKTVVIPALEKKYSVKYGKVVFKVFGLEEDTIIKKLADIKKQASIEFNVVGENLDYKVEIIYDDKSTKMDYDYAQKEFIFAFHDNIYAEKDITLEKILVDLLKLRKTSLATAESFTGGNISAKITSVSGASSVFYESIVCYNEQSKQLRLGVEESSIKRFKPVSDQVAGEMVCGLINTGKVDLAISTTGIAGPNSDDSGFPVGLCYIGIAYDGQVKVHKFVFDGNREQITEKGTKMAMFLAVKLLKNI